MLSFSGVEPKVLKLATSDFIHFLNLNQITKKKPGVKCFRNKWKNLMYFGIINYLGVVIVLGLWQEYVFVLVS